MTDLDRIAARRDELHAAHDTRAVPAGQRSRNIVGLAGEYVFAKRFDLDIDLEERIGGDDGIDFVVDGLVVDVKTVDCTTIRGEVSLLVQASKVDRCDVYVLAKAWFAPRRRVRLIGWEFASVVREVEPRQWPELLNHVIPETDLRPMCMLQHATWLRAYES